MGPDEENEKGTDVPCRICGHDACRLDIESGVCLRCRRHLGLNKPMLEMWATVMDRIRKLERDARRVITAEEIRDTEPAKRLRAIGERISKLGKPTEPEPVDEPSFPCAGCDTPVGNDGDHRWEYTDGYRVWCRSCAKKNGQAGGHTEKNPISPVEACENLHRALLAMAEKDRRTAEQDSRKEKP